MGEARVMPLCVIIWQHSPQLWKYEQLNAPLLADKSRKQAGEEGSLSILLYIFQESDLSGILISGIKASKK